MPEQVGGRRAQARQATSAADVASLSRDKSSLELRLEEERTLLEGCLVDVQVERDAAMCRALAAEARVGRKRRAVRTFVSTSTARVRKLGYKVQRSLQRVRAPQPKEPPTAAEAAKAAAEAAARELRHELRDQMRPRVEHKIRWSFWKGVAAGLCFIAVVRFTRWPFAKLKI